MNDIRWEKDTPECYEGYVNGVCKYWIYIGQKGKCVVCQSPNPSAFFLKTLTLDDAWRAVFENEQKIEALLALWHQNGI